MRTGLKASLQGAGQDKDAGSALPRTWPPVQNVKSWEGLLRVGLVGLLRSEYALNDDDDVRGLPETLKNDVQRMVRAQHKFQHVLVTVACLLVFKQGCIVQRQMAAETAGEAQDNDMSRRMVDFKTKISIMLADPNVRLPDIAAEVSSNAGLSDPSFADNLLRKMTSRQDSTFNVIERSVAEALFYLILLGPIKGGEAAKSALNKCAGSVMLEDIQELAASLAKVADVSSRVHGPWYAEIAEQVLV